MTLKDSCYTQKTIADLAKTSGPTIARYMANGNLDPIKDPGASKQRKKISYENTRKLIGTCFSHKHLPIKQTQVFYNFKGGTGKTSLCYQVGAHLAIMGYSVLLIDLDPQAHLTNFFHEISLKSSTLYDVVSRNIPIRSAILSVAEGLDLIPSNLSLTRVESELNSKMARESVLDKHISPLKERYDFILIDTNPTISTLNRNAIFASDRVNIVCETQPLSLDGLKILFEELKGFTVDLNYNGDFRIIANKYDPQTITSREVMGALMSDYSSYMMDAVIRKCEDINISSKLRLPVSSFCKTSSSSYEDILELVHKIIFESCAKKETKHSNADKVA